MLRIMLSVLSQHWKHCPGVSNPADIPSRGMLPLELSENQLWLNGLEWLATSSYLSDSPVEIGDNLPEECYSELKCHTVIQLFTSNDHINQPQLEQVINCKNYNSFNHLSCVTVLVLKFANSYSRI